MPQIQTEELLYFYLQRNANVQQHAHVLVLPIYINQNWLLKVFFFLSLSFNIFFTCKCNELTPSLFLIIFSSIKKPWDQCLVNIHLNHGSNGKKSYFTYLVLPLKNVRWSKIKTMNVLHIKSIVPNSSTSNFVTWFSFSEPCFCFISLSIYWKHIFVFYKMEKMMPNM